MRAFILWSPMFLVCWWSTGSTAQQGSCTFEKVIADVARSVITQTASLIVDSHNNNNNNNNNQRSIDSVQSQTRTLETAELKPPGSELKPRLPRDCAEVATAGQSVSGVFRVWPDGWTSRNGMEVYCDLEQDGGGWTVIQRRGHFGNPNDYFYRRWRDYKFGFGNLTQDFWLGNDKIYYLSNQDNYVLRVNLGAKDEGSRYAQYDEFFIEGESSKYKLWIYGFAGDAGDSLSPHNGMFFGTSDRDNDNFERNCAEEFKGAWWYNKCHESNLNGLYHDGQHDTFANGVNWKAWKGYHYSYRDVEIKIRPKFFRKVQEKIPDPPVAV